MTIEVKDLRQAERYLAVQALSGSFGAVSVSILDLSGAGAQIEHAQPLRVGMRARFWFRSGGTTVAGPATTIWSHLKKTPDSLLYHSGIKLDDPAELAAALNILVDLGVLKRDLESLERKRKLLIAREREKSGKAVMTMLRTEPDVPADQRLLIEQVRSRLRVNPEQEAEAIWEYLERSIELTTIVKVLEKG